MKVMKKFFTLCMMLLMGLGLYAQTDADRLVINLKSGEVKGYMAERIESVTFPKVAGKVVAEATINEVTADKIFVAVTPSADCSYYKILPVPTVTANQLKDDAVAARYIESRTNTDYNQAFTNAEMPTTELNLDTDYTFMTLAYDKYNTPCGVCRAPFKTLGRPLVGSPKVTCTVKSVDYTTFTVHCEANADVAGYACVAGEAGTMQEQYEQFAPMFGFTNFGQMIKAWGIERNGTTDVDWSGMDPGLDYEVFVQAWDVNGTFTECEVVKLSTPGYGGDGEALVFTEQGDYKNTDWGGSMLPSQFINFKPNDQTNAWRFGVVTKKQYSEDPQGWQDNVRQEPPMPSMANWFFFGELSTDFQINPNVEFVVITAGKNAKNEWGPVRVDEYTTPAAVAANVKVAMTNATTYGIIGRMQKKMNYAPFEPGKMPVIPAAGRKAGLKLTETK